MEPTLKKMTLGYNFSHAFEAANPITNGTVHWRPVACAHPLAVASLHLTRATTPPTSVAPTHMSGQFAGRSESHADTTMRNTSIHGQNSITPNACTLEKQCAHLIVTESTVSLIPCEWWALLTESFCYWFSLYGIFCNTVHHPYEFARQKITWFKHSRRVKRGVYLGCANADDVCHTNCTCALGGFVPNVLFGNTLFKACNKTKEKETPKSYNNSHASSSSNKPHFCNHLKSIL